MWLWPHPSQCRTADRLTYLDTWSDGCLHYTSHWYQSQRLVLGRGESGIIWKYWEYVYWVRYKASLSVHLLDKIILDYTIIGSSDGNPIWSQLSRPHHSCSVVDSLEMNSISYCTILCQYISFLKNFFIKDSLWKYIFEIIKG